MRSFKSVLLSSLATVIGLSVQTNTFAGQDRPNIIVFFVDDMGWQDTSVPFWTQKTPQNEFFRTPNMERLAAKSYKFTDAYATPLCTPSRVSLITGANAARHKISSWVRADINSPNLEAGEADWNSNGLSPVPNLPHSFHATPLPKLLSDNGYYTVLSGKGHYAPLGMPGADPANLGYKVRLATGESSFPASYYGQRNYDNPVDGKSSRAAVKDLEKYHGTETFLTTAITREALNAIEKPIAEEQPFYLYLAHYAVHTPIQADSHYVHHYRNKGLSDMEIAYASLIESMDASLGLVLDYLEMKSINENTVVFFISDNGGVALLPPWTDFADGSRNAPLRSGKATIYEGGIRVPLLVRYPGKTDSPTTVSQYVQIEDLFPTILDIAQVKDRTGILQTVDGQSLLPYLDNPGLRNDDRALLWHLPHYPNNKTGWASAIRKGQWKLVYNYNLESLELYDLANDIGEQHDVAGANPAKLKELTLELSKLLEERGAKFPTKTPGRESVRLPAEILKKQGEPGKGH